MKKILILLMTAFMIFGMTACGEEKDSKEEYEETKDNNEDDKDNEIEEDSVDEEKKKEYEFNKERNFAGIVIHYYVEGSSWSPWSGGEVAGTSDYVMLMNYSDDVRFDGETLEELPTWCEPYLIESLTDAIHFFEDKELEIMEQSSKKITNSNGCEMMRVESLVEITETGETMEMTTLYILGGVDRDVAIYITAIPETDGYDTGELIDAMAEQIESVIADE